MKKIVKILFVAFVASLTIVSCSKPNTAPKDQDNGTEENTDNKDKEEEAKLAVDGKFGEWASLTPVAGSDGLLLMKAQMTDEKIYFYIEADTDAICTEDSSYANYLSIYLDCGDGAEPLTYWGGTEGCTYGPHFDIWLMQQAKANMANWDAGFSGKAKISDGVYRGEFCLSRATEELKANIIYFGAALSDTYVEYPGEGETEGSWINGEVVGLCPEQGEDMAVIKKAK